MSLMELKERPFPFNEKYFLDKETEREYQRLVGGIAWPVGGKAGWAVILGEDRKKDETLQKHFIYVLGEYSSENPSDLVERCNQYRHHLLVNAWYGHPNASMLEFLRRVNLSLPIRSAPFYDDENVLELYLSLIRELTLPSKKTLYFGKNSKIPGHLMEVPAKRVQHAKAQDFPGVLALGYALSALQHLVPDHVQEAELRQAEAELGALFND